MIAQAIFKILSLDSTNIAQSTALAKLQIRYPGFQGSYLRDCHYRSLKTLLGETITDVDAYNNPEWAKRHIFVHEKSQRVDVNDLSKENTPLIIAEYSNIKLINENGHYQGILDIHVYTNANKDQSGLAIDLDERIKSRFIYNPPDSNVCIKNFENIVPGLGAIKIQHNTSISMTSDHIVSNYTIYFQVYQVINDV